MRQIRLGEVEILIIAHKDSLVRFAFDFIEEFTSWYGCEIIVAKENLIFNKEFLNSSQVKNEVNKLSGKDFLIKNKNIPNQESLSPQQEMVEDLMAIIHSFSCRLYGLRSYKKQIREIASISLDTQDKKD